MIIAVTGEGPLDYGSPNYQTEEWEWGSAGGFIEQIAEEKGVPLQLVPIERQDVERVRLQRHLRGLSGKAVLARKFCIRMKEQGFAYGIYYSDSDRDTGAKNTEQAARKRFDTLYSEIRQGLTLPNHVVMAIPMLAMRMIECWLLSDKSSIEIACERKNSTVQMPSNPEGIWGDKRDPDSNYPKNRLDRVIKEITGDGKKSINRVLAYEIARNASTDLLKEKCPVSYGQFHKDLSDMLEHHSCEAIS